MEKQKNDVAPNGAGACGGNRTPANLLKAEEKGYEEWRRKNLGECYANTLDYNVAFVNTAEVGRGVLDVLKPGDKILVAFDVSDDPCMQHGDIVEGYVPVYGEHCRCKRSEYDEYAIVQLPLYIRRSVLKRRYNIPPPSSEEILSRLIYYLTYYREIFPIYHKQFIIVEYKGDGIAEIVDTDDYDYYFHVAKIDTAYNDLHYRVDDVEVEGAVWHAIYYVAYNHTIYDKSGNKIADLGVCCYDDIWSHFIVLLLIRRGEIAKIKYFDNGKEKYEHIVTASLPPVVSVASAPRS